MINEQRVSESSSTHNHSTTLGWKERTEGKKKEIHRKASKQFALHQRFEKVILAHGSPRTEKYQLNGEKKEEKRKIAGY